MHFKKILGLAAVVASAILLASCGNSSSKSSTKANDTLTFWYGGDADTAVKPIASEFTKKTGVKVKIQSIPWSQYNDKLLTAAASKTGPDVLVVGTTQMANFVGSKTLMDVTDTVKNDAAVAPDKFFAGSENTTKFNGKYYGLPWYVETRVLYYRKDLLKSVGYNQAPKTWDELYDAATKLSKRGKNMYGFNVDGAEPTFGFMFARQNGATLLKNGKPQFNKKAMVDSLEYLNKFTKNGASPKQDTKLSIGQSFGGNGPVPMFISGPWMMSSIKNDAGLKDSQWGVAELPKGKDNNMSSTGGGNLAVFNYTKNKKNAVKFVKFMSKKENQLKYYKNSDSMPTLKAAWQDEALSDSRIQVFRKQLNNSQPMPLIKQWDQIGQNYLKSWEQIALNNANVQKTMDSFNTQTEELINK
ncbi:MAG: sugar ABC transporter substrate-binding protein [Lactobacillaceae bacterium]|jgi:multiple sugar transport system substrate-binding protein|nr:sugar ABC transporter substrate-binding protein [Lactobacillaceae bacterium]